MRHKRKREESQSHGLAPQQRLSLRLFRRLKGLGGLLREADWRRFPDRVRSALCCRSTMCPKLIVISVSILHLFASVRRGQEPVLVQALGSEPAVECFDVGTVRRLTRGSPGSHPCPWASPRFGPYMRSVKRELHLGRHFSTYGDYGIHGPNPIA